MKKKSKEELDKVADEINREMRAGLSRMIGDKQDSSDIAYVMAQAYFKVQGMKLVDDKVYQEDKHIATIKECDHDGKKLHLKVRYVDPLHDIVLDFEEKKVDGKSQNQD